MGWSLVNYDSLNLRYTNVTGESYIIRKAFTKFRILYDTADFVEMFVTDDVYYWNPLSSGGPAGAVYYNVKAAPLNRPWTQTLFYYEGSNPQSTSAQDLLNLLNGLLLSADVKVEKNGTFVGEQESINFIEGANITLTAVDDPVNNRVNLTIASAGGAGGVTTFSAGTTGFTPVAPTAGAVTLGGTLAITNGGTGLSTVPTNGQLLIGNGTGYTLSTITAGPGISITNGIGTITINNTGTIDDPFPKILMLMGG